MVRQQIGKIFDTIIEKAKLDFAITYAVGDCNTCTWAELESDYGQDAHGIWLKYFTFGGNKAKWNKEYNYIAHYLTQEQKEIVKAELEKHFIVEWEDMKDSTCIKIIDKRSIQQ